MRCRFKKEETSLQAEENKVKKRILDRITG
jgi:hypothetical protein